MDKIWLVIQREYLTRVQKKSFIIMSILGPVLMAALMIVPIYLAKMSDEVKTVGIVDESGFFTDAFDNTDKIIFHSMRMEIADAKKAYETMNYDMVLYIPEPSYTYPSKIFIYSSKEPGMQVENYIRSSINNDLRTMRLKDAGVGDDVISAMKNKIDLTSISIDELGGEEERSGTLNLILGFVLALSIYFFIFMYGTQVMRGVLEEKTSRIIEVIISSIKPFQLMMGKIIGIAMVGLTQFILWTILTFGIVTAVSTVFMDNPEQIMTSQTSSIMGDQMVQGQNIQVEAAVMNSFVSQIEKFINSVNWVLILGAFLFYFLGGYLLYAALFAAVGSAVDAEADTQQFLIPITVPLILAIMMFKTVLDNPDGALAFWGSIIPLTSPIVMMMRIPFGVPISELILSMVLLIAAFIFFTWISGKIYRVGILMYGKKVNYKELWKWIRHH